MRRSRRMVVTNLAIVRKGIEEACERVGRDPGTVRLVAVGKTVEPEALSWAVEAGVTDLGENYVKELGTKREAVTGATWHFVGTLQSRTAPKLAELADVVQTVAPGRAMARLASRAAERDRELPALVEVDFTRERSGVSPEAVPAACAEVARTQGLRLVGLMTVPPITATPEEARRYFQRLRALRDEAVDRHPDASELSMGMSLDYEVAIEEGATMVRIGTALFGARPPASTGRT